MVIVGGQIYDDVIPIVVGVDGVETEVGVGLTAGCKSAVRVLGSFCGKRTLYLATTPPASLSIT